MFSNLKDRQKVKNISRTTTELETVANPYRSQELEAGDWSFHQNVIKQIVKILDDQTENRIIFLHGGLGAWKSEALKKLEEPLKDESDKNYIPIYLDSRKYAGLGRDDFLLSISNNVLEKLNRAKFEFENEVLASEHINIGRIKGQTVEAIVLGLDAPLEEGDVLLIIFDHVEYLLENIDVKVISEYIRYFKNLEMNWSKYGLIIAAGRRRIDFITDNSIIQLLNKAHPIEIKEFWDEKGIRNFIVDPIKNQRLSYHEEAIAKIIWYAGKNLYFQQLICFELHSYFTRNVIKERNQIVAKDVEQVIQRILNEKDIEECNYIWTEKMSLASRMIVAALADNRTIKKDIYFLGENRLLTDSLGKGRIHKELEKLKAWGYLIDEGQQNSSEFSFKIPLFEMWVQKKHSFLKTVLEEIAGIAEKVNLSILCEEIKKVPADDLAPFNKETITEIVEKWNSLRNVIRKGSVPERRIIKNFMGNLAAVVNLNLEDNHFPINGHYFMDIRNLNIGILREALCFLQTRPKLMEEDIANIERMATARAQDTQTQLTLFIYLQRSDIVEKLVKKTYLNLIAIDENELKQVILSKRPQTVFRKFILENLSLQKVSSFQTAGPSKTIFYGRSNIINRINSSLENSYSIVGARKIGKSSLLYKIKDKPPPNIVYIFMNLEVTFSRAKSYNPFLKSLESEIQRVCYKKVSFGSFPFGRDISKLPEIIKKLILGEERNRRVVFILDEIDSLLEFDRKRDFKLIRVFRNMSQKKISQFIFAGFKELYNYKRDIKNPLYNFSEEIRLKPLDREAAFDLITKPMESIGINYENEEIKELILEYTACHPNLLQFFCKHLVEKIEKHNRPEDRRTIYKEDVEYLFGASYEEYIMDEIYMFYSDLSSVQRLILVLLVEEYLKQSNGKTFSINDVRNKLIDEKISISINDVHGNLRNLAMRFILTDVGSENYTFALPFFPDILKKRIDGDFKETLIQEIKGNESKSI